MNQEFQSIAGYIFYDLKNREQIRYPLRDFCRDRGIRGTILLSTEGMNIFVSGRPTQLSEFTRHLHDDLKVPSIDYKTTWHETQPFRRMVVRLKKEIITMGVPEIEPAKFTGPRISPQEFKDWLDQGKDIVVLDTRNDYEIEVGKFKGAIDLNVKTFSEFARKSKELPEDLKKKPVVMYCTGGIRCEKASAHFIQNLGFKEIYQLDGGILNYFNQVGKAHYEGECFVFINNAPESDHGFPSVQN